MIPFTQHSFICSSFQKAESLALIVARLLDDKLKTGNSTLKDLMVLQMIATDAISQKLSALEVRCSNFMLHGVLLTTSVGEKRPL